MADMMALGPHDARDRRSLVTPEGIDLSLGLARGGARAGAFMIDLLLMLLALVVLTILAFAIGSAAVGSGNEVTKEIVTSIWLLGSFFIRTGYFILFEAGPRGATLGKRALGLRVIARNGERLTVESVVARNLMREVEVFVPLSLLFYSAAREGSSGWLDLVGMGWVLLFLLFPLFNKDRLRVGDLLAGTWVINIPKKRLGYDLAAQEPLQAARLSFTPEQLDAYGVYELQTLEQVLREGQYATVQLVASTIRHKIGHWEAADDYQFLQDYYAATRAHMERGLLFGRRRANKFDR